MTSTPNNIAGEEWEKNLQQVIEEYKNSDGYFDLIDGYTPLVAFIHYTLGDAWGEGFQEGERIFMKN